MATSPGSDNALPIATAKLGGGPLPVSIEIPIRSSLFLPLRRLFRREPIAQLVHIPWGRALVFVPEDDNGEVHIWLSVVNMSDRLIKADQLHLEQLLSSGNALAVAPPLFSPPEKAVPGYSIGEIFFKVALSGPAIRLLLRTVQRANNTYSSPSTQMIVSGRVVLAMSGRFSALQRAKKVTIPFLVDLRALKLELSCPSTKS